MHLEVLRHVARICEGDKGEGGSQLAADYLGLAYRGRLARDTFSDLLELDEELRLRSVLIEGEPIES
jgi:N-acetylglucosamine-6-phosphate deacetylase